MEITNIDIKMTGSRGSKLLGYACITLDDSFVVRDIKIVQGSETVFVAMPSRRLQLRCPRCRAKNHLRASYCNECGVKLPPARVDVDSHGRPKLHADIAHPINSACREKIQTAVVSAYDELRRQPPDDRDLRTAPREASHNPQRPPEDEPAEKPEPDNEPPPAKPPPKDTDQPKSDFGLGIFA